MEVLIIFILVIIVYFMTKSSYNSVLPQAPCKTHKWVYVKQPKELETDPDIEYLKCNICQKTPTDIVNSVDN